VEQTVKSRAGLKICLAVIMAALWSPQANAGPLTLDACIKGAIHQSPMLEADRYQVAAAGQEVSKQQGLIKPELNGQLTGNELNGEPVWPFSVLNVRVPEENGIFPGQRFRRHVNWGLVATQGATVTYPLYQNGSIMGLNDAPAASAARAQLTEQEIALLLSQQKVVLDVTAAFSYALWYQREAEIGAAKVILSEKRLAVVQSQVALGMRLPQDVQVAKAQLAADQQALASARQDEREASMELATLIGHSTDETLELDRSEPRAVPLPALGDFLARVMPVHPALQVQRSKIEVAHQEYLLARSAMLPTASLQTSFTVAEDLDHATGGELHKRPSLFLSVLQVQIPLLDFGQRRAATNESLDKFGSERARLRQLALELRTALTAAYRDLHGIEKDLAVRESDYLSADNQARLTRAQRKLGMVDELALIGAELTLLVAREPLEADRLTRRLKYAELQNLSGGSWTWLQ
jgi:outer membrane protein TolC